MALSRKPSSRTKKDNDVDIDALIGKGGSVAPFKETPMPDTAPAERSFSMKLPMPLSDRIDTLRKLRTIRVPRSTWVLEAVVEKLERDEKKLQVKE